MTLLNDYLLDIGVEYSIENIGYGYDTDFIGICRYKYVVEINSKKFDFIDKHENFIKNKVPSIDDILCNLLINRDLLLENDDLSFLFSGIITDKKKLKEATKELTKELKKDKNKLESIFTNEQLLKLRELVDLSLGNYGEVLI